MKHGAEAPFEDIVRSPQLRKEIESLKKGFADEIAERDTKISKLDSQFENCKTAFIRICKELDDNWVWKEPSPDAPLSSTPPKTLSQILDQVFSSEPDFQKR